MKWNNYMWNIILTFAGSDTASVILLYFTNISFDLQLLGIFFFILCTQIGIIIFILWRNSEELKKYDRDNEDYENYLKEKKNKK